MVFVIPERIRNLDETLTEESAEATTVYFILPAI